MAARTWTSGGVTAVTPDAVGPDSLIAWDDLVARTPGSDVNQLHAWARIRAATGLAPRYVFVHDGDELVAGAQVLERRIPGVGSIGYLPYGPVLAASAADDRDVLAVLGHALEHLGRHRLRMLFVQPPEVAEGWSRGLGRFGFRPSDAGIAPPGSVRVDLGPSEEELRSRLRNQRLRRLARGERWESRGVRVRLGTADDVPAFADLLAHTARHQGFDPFSTGYLRRLYQELSGAGHVALFVGEIHGEAVAAHLYTACGGVLKFRLTGFDRTREVARVGLPGVVHWAALRWAKAQGYRWFDLGGLGEPSLRAALHDPGAPELPSYDRYKLDFGGTVFRYPQPVELIGSRAVRGAYDVARQGAAGRTMLRTARRLLRYRNSVRS